MQQYQLNIILNSHCTELWSENISHEAQGLFLQLGVYGSVQLSLWDDNINVVNSALRADQTIRCLIHNNNYLASNSKHKFRAYLHYRACGTFTFNCFDWPSIKIYIRKYSLHILRMSLIQNIRTMERNGNSESKSRNGNATRWLYQIVVQTVSYMI